ncbi:MAG TPA: GNAT family N-acetyltransferase [Pseudonocardiaceae bacterium]|nr:GNAT family N-acetyltransferase [Pseudonocardiaceae bacterium]
MDSSTLTIRTLTEDDIPAFVEVLSNAFLNDANSDWENFERRAFEPGRSLGVFDGARLVGCGKIITKQITVPGLRVTPVAAVSCVGVAADHRRRGVLSRMMRAQLHGLHETGGEPFAALWASESPIYGRYGYGFASQAVGFDLLKGAEFRPETDFGADRIRELPLAEATPLLEAIYQKVAPSRIGWLTRSATAWEEVLVDVEHLRGGISARRFAVHPEGYAVYRTKGGRDERGPSGEMEVVEIVAGTPQAYASLWRYLLSVDLVAKIHARLGSDEALVHLLAEPMNVIRRHHPALWVRLVDLDRALTARRYSGPVDLVLEVDDELCPWNAGRWRLHVDASGEAEVTRTEADADLALGIVELGAAFLGGTRLSTLASAGRVRERTEGGIARASAAFLGEQDPSCVEVF